MLRGFFSICNSVITDDFGNYDAIILENFSTTLLLGFSMLVMLTPLFQGFLVPPEGNGENFFSSERLEKRSTEMNPSISSSSVRNSAAKSK